MWQPEGRGVGEQRMRAVWTRKRPRRKRGVYSIRDPVAAVPAGFTQANMVNRALLDRRKLKQRGVKALVQAGWAIPKVGTGQREDKRFCVAGTRPTGKGGATHPTVVGKASEIKRIQDPQVDAPMSAGVGTREYTGSDGRVRHTIDELPLGENAP